MEDYNPMLSQIGPHVKLKVLNLEKGGIAVRSLDYGRYGGM